MEVTWKTQENIVPSNMVNLTVVANSKSDKNKIKHKKYKRMILNALRKFTNEFIRAQIILGYTLFYELMQKTKS